MEKLKWQKEFQVYSKLVNTIVFTGNINDQHPIVNETEGVIKGFVPFDSYLARASLSAGYQAVIHYDPIDGFSQMFKNKCQKDAISEMKTVIDVAREEAGTSGNAILRYTSHKNSAGEDMLLPSCFEDAAHIINLMLIRASFSIAIIVNHTSRMVARPEDLDIDERMTYMYFQLGAINAKKNRAGDPEKIDSVANPIIQNQLYLIADKLNDLPAWFSLSHPSLKCISISKPDFNVRAQIIEEYATQFPGYAEATYEEQKKFLDSFVGSSEGFSTQDIARVFQVARIRGISINNISKAVLLYKHGVPDNPWTSIDDERLVNAEEVIKSRVLGQEHAVKSAVNIIKRAAMGMSGLQHSAASSKPRGIMFLAGPTGTGKTELAKAITERIFLDEKNMIRFDMSEYRQPQSDQRLLGAPPGYVGYEAGGQLTNAVREHPFSVLLFDEIEKAHPSVLDKFLQILEDGRITDGRGETVYFQDCLIIFTSNLGITIPSTTDPRVRIENVKYEVDTNYEDVKNKVIKGIQDYFNFELGRPEILNRIGNNILVFDFIREDGIMPILNKQIKSVSKNLWEERKIKLTISEEAMKDLYDFAVVDLPKAQGGRGIGNMVEDKLINPLATFVYDNCISNNAEINIERILLEKGNVEIKATFNR